MTISNVVNSYNVATPSVLWVASSVVSELRAAILKPYEGVSRLEISDTDRDMNMASVDSHLEHSDGKLGLLILDISAADSIDSTMYDFIESVHRGNIDGRFQTIEYPNIVVFARGTPHLDSINMDYWSIMLPSWGGVPRDEIQSIVSGYKATNAMAQEHPDIASVAVFHKDLCEMIDHLTVDTMKYWLDDTRPVIKYVGQQSLGMYSNCYEMDNEKKDVFSNSLYGPFVRELTSGEIDEFRSALERVGKPGMVIRVMHPSNIPTVKSIKVCLGDTRAALTAARNTLASASGPEAVKIADTIVRLASRMEELCDDLVELHD